MPDAVPNTTPGADPPADLTGQAVGDFQILRRLGAGGMGQVYLARQLSLKREVALKFLRSELNANTTALKRFEAEAHAVARLNHPNIVQVYAIGEHLGLRYMALEYVEGRNLREYLARKGPPDLPVSLSIMRQVAFALQKAHDEGIVHRDIKPENIMVTRKVGVKVADFGLSRVFAGEGLHLTQSGMTLGTPLYLSPEQAQGRAVDHRSDIYSFGVTCYHLLGGEPPFRGATAVEVALKHVTDQPRPLLELRPDLPPDLCAVVHKMMAKKVADRYQSAREILRDLVKVREGLAVGLTQAVSLSTSAPSSSLAASPLPSSPLAASRRWLLATAVCAVAAAGGVGGYLLLNPAPEPQAVVPPPPPTVGLPDVRPPERLTTARERELLATLANRTTKGDDVIAAALELGLLYIREANGAPQPGREKLLEEARGRFEALEKERLDGPISAGMAKLVGQLGRAVVLAYQDKADESDKLLLIVVNAMAGKAAPKKEPAAGLQNFLLRYPDLGQAVAEAVVRNAANLAPAKIPPALEPLRTPRGMPKKD